jgi:hypothetical protein
VVKGNMLAHRPSSHIRSERPGYDAGLWAIRVSGIGSDEQQRLIQLFVDRHSN